MSDVLHLTHEEADELAGLFVLDALTPAEADAMREHLATCPESHADLAELAAVTPALAAMGGTVEAPADLRGRVLATVAATPQVPDDVTAVAVAGLAAAVAPAPVVPAPGPVVAPARPVMPVVAMPAPPRRSAPAHRGRSRCCTIGCPARPADPSAVGLDVDRHRGRHRSGRPDGLERAAPEEQQPAQRSGGPAAGGRRGAGSAGCPRGFA